MIDKDSLKPIVEKASVFFMLVFFACWPAYAQERNPLVLVNSPYDEQHPVFSPGGDLYFTIAFHPENQNGVMDPGDIWMSSSQEDGLFQQPRRVADLSTSGYDVFIGFLSPVSAMVYHDGKGRSRGIHQYSRSGNSWEYQKQVKLGSFRNLSDHFSGRLVPSGDVLVLSIESFGSYGNEDIYVSFLDEGGSWSTPQNLGPAVNTHQQEMTPFLSADKKVLFFSSNGHGGQGGRDIFDSSRLDESWERWSEPLPLSMGNTIGVELAYVELQDRPGNAVYTTTQNSEGYGDLVWLPAEEPPLATVESPDTDAEPVLLEPLSGLEVKKVEEALEPIEPKLDEAIVEKEERLSPAVDLAEPLMEKSLLDSAQATSEGHQAAEQIEALDIPRMEEIDFAVAKEESMVLENVFFKRGTAELSDLNSQEFIRQLAAFLVENPEIKILLEGHTDNLGNPRLNRELSLDRASAIRDILMGFGVAFERVRIAGWGGERPIANNRDEEGRQKNRRVEMRIVE